MNHERRQFLFSMLLSSFVLLVLSVSNVQANHAAVLDYDNDGATDEVLFRLTDNTWYVNPSSGGSFFGAQFGLAQNDVLTPGDFDGDDFWDYAVWREVGYQNPSAAPENHTQSIFYVLRSSDSSFQAYAFGTTGDIPLARDYDGDGKYDFAVVRRQGGQLVWYINNSSDNSFSIPTFGLDTDVPAPADYDGDGKDDLAVQRGNTGEAEEAPEDHTTPATFYVLNSVDGSLRVVNFQGASDFVVPGDYDGDGKFDIAVVSQGTPFIWYILQSTDGATRRVEFGEKPYYSVQGDYDGDGSTDIAIFDPLEMEFRTLQSSDGTTSTTKFGLSGDYPVANYNTN